MALARRDAFDLALVTVGLLCVYSYVVDPSGPQTALGVLVETLLGLNPLVYLVGFGAGGILFLAYALLYLPGQQYG